MMTCGEEQVRVFFGDELAEIGHGKFILGKAEPLPFYRTAEMTPEWLSAREASAPAMHRVGAFRAEDQHGAVITERALSAKVTIVSFFFATCADICPTTTHNLASMLAEAGSDPRIQLLSYSITPEHNSAAVLREFARAHGIADPRWHLLRSSAAATAALARDAYFAPLGDSTSYGGVVAKHTERVVLVDGDGRLRGVYGGSLPLEMIRLREDVGVLLGR